MSVRVLSALVLACALCCGCATPRGSGPPTAVAQASASQPTTAVAAVYEPDLLATVAPPPGWRLDIKTPEKPNVRHYVWVSPSGNTAFGVMKFALPIPAPHDPVLWLFLNEMRRSEGAAELISKISDRKLRGIRFEAVGGRYRIRTNFTIRGLTGWMAYAGTLIEHPVNEQELSEAVQARESIQLGKQK